MKIKTIEISGFKSFSEKALLNFLPGITALVGPNGCGKSNVVDAFRWAMGEQSAKQLRGNLMEDVIFSGSESRKPMSMAEVSITFTNENGSVPHQYSNYSEIMVTRRLFRSGESEYYINKTPCRLKDITELFLDTGAGAKAYSIIEQGKVDQIINAKPFDRRVLIDEVAGISKYKSRKKEALSKIESTKNNLSRVEDIIIEVKRQLNAIKRQSSKLKRYQALREEIKKIEIASSLKHYSSLKDNHTVLQNDLEQASREEIKKGTTISSIEALLEDERFQLSHDEKLYQSIQEEIYKITSSSQKEESRLEYLTKEISSSEAQYHQHLQNIETLELRVKDHHHEELTLEERNREHNKTIQEITSSLIHDEEQLVTLKDQYAEIHSNLESEKNNLIDILTVLARINNTLAQMEKEHLSLLRKIEFNKGETENLEQKKLALEQVLSSARTELSTTEESKHHREDEKHLLDKRISALEEQLQQIESELTEAREKCEKTESRLVSLQELKDKFEECEDGVRSIMLRTQTPHKETNGIYGLLADFIQTDPQYESALEAVLGEKLHYIVVENHLSGREALEYLKLQSLGRASLIPLHIRKYNEEQVSTALADYNVKPLLQLVSAENEYRPIVDSLLSDVLLVDTFDTALKIWNSNGHKYTLVTLDGEIIDPTGIITGGRKNGNSSQILSKRREIRELQDRLSTLTPQYEELSRTKAQLTSQLSQFREKSDTLNEEIHQTDLISVSLKRDINQALKDIDEASQRIDFFKLEQEEFNTALQNASEETTRLQDEKNHQQTEQREKESFLEQLKQQEETILLEIDSLQSEITKRKIQLTAEREKFENNLTTLSRTKENLTLLKEELNASSSKTDEWKEKQTTMQQDVRTAEENIAEYQRAHQDLEYSLSKIRSDLVIKEEKIKEKEKNLKTLRAEQEQEKTKINDLNVKITESNLTISHLLSSIDEKYHLNLETLLRDRVAGEPEDEQHSFERLEELKAQIEKLGEVNLAAAQEEEELSQRHQFLSDQRDDLLKSLEALNQAIRKINRTTRQRFVETFHTINDKFQAVFPELFQGGRSELKLTDQENILETGIEIAAQPPGKKLQSIDLLSGGEKTLTAVALLISIFLVKPSPFCLLDEADSALDDLNATRFNNYMQKISHTSQFILITHNKLSMQAAHTLYGITMQEPGSSKVVSVKLQ
jgi:chromosome segregation protein